LYHLHLKAESEGIFEMLWYSYKTKDEEQIKNPVGFKASVVWLFFLSSNSGTNMFNPRIRRLRVFRHFLSLLRWHAVAQLGVALR
jgi:hypothetical protein